MEALATLAAVLAVGVLVIVVVSVIQKGDRRHQPRLLHEHDVVRVLVRRRDAFRDRQRDRRQLVIVSFAVLMALPVGVLAAIYLNEFASPRVRAPLQLALDVLNGIPAIVIGIFVYVLLVLHGGSRALKASFALAILMLPLVARSTQEVLALVPDALREGSLALGAAQVAHDAQHRPAAGGRRDHHRRHARDRARRGRDGTAALHLVARRQRRQLGSEGAALVDAVLHLQRGRAGRSEAPDRPGRPRSS